MGTGQDGQSGRGNSTARRAATYASTASGHGHTMATGDTASDPSPRPWPNEGEEGSLTSNKGTEKSWPARNGQGSGIAKEHGRRPGRDGHEVRPSTRLQTAVRNGGHLG